jgi:hypothetical protein
MNVDRAVRSLVDVVAVEQVAPGMVEVVTWSDSYAVDARDAGCNCPDKQYNLDDTGGMCKHEYAALVADVDTIPTPFEVTDDLDQRAVADGGHTPDGSAEASDRAKSLDDTERSLKDVQEKHGEAERPDDCECGEWNDGSGLPCWPCYREGFRTVARTEDDSDDDANDELTGTDTPKRSEPADFGLGDSTGVQDL